MSELTLQLPPELVDAIADAVAAKLAGQLPQSDAAEPWRLWDVDEVCQRLGRSQRWVLDKTRSGELPHVRLDGGAKAYLADDVEQFARARRVPIEDAEEIPGRGRRLKAVGKDWLDE